ncbi:atg18p [Saccharomyces arboricola H-6]|uniref:Autophagy-related protein 18 n=1 Tax=Saccharomyces arboricola (strain H-6 / AS 2.3317 / CBS 10644) TaxID=1160507 RepID=J8PP26_SACAR|nr:atg18p [Saccharomyces arboricola H-6]
MSDTSPTINFINFNQTGTCISLGTSNGFKIFNCEPFGKFYSEDSGGYAIVEMLFSTSLLALVGIGDQPALSPRRLRIINTKKHSIICEVTFPTSILSVKMNKSRLVVLLQEQIYIYNINTMRLLHTIETNSNPRGLMAMSPSVANSNLVYPSPPKLINSEIKAHATTNNITLSVGGNTDPSFKRDQQDIGHNDINYLDQYSSFTKKDDTDPTSNNNGHSSIIKNGDVIVFNLETLQPTMVIEAHKGEIAAMAISFDGTLMATASDKGTIIRVFDIETGDKVYQFRRGTYATRIYSISFSEDSQYLAVTGSSKTVHIFKLGHSMSNNRLDSDDSNMEADDSSLDTNSIDALSDEEHSLRLAREPYVDASRKTMGRMIRYSSQKLSRRAARTLGQIFPIKVTSLLESSRHFASLKLPIETHSHVMTISSIGSPIDIDTSEYPELFETGNTSTTEACHDLVVKMVPIRVVSSDGYLYNFVMDPERGGDCLILSQYSILVD